MACKIRVQNRLKTENNMTSADGTSEKSLLVQNDIREEINNSDAERHLKIPKWLAIVLGIAVTVLQLLSFVLNMYITNQYSYQAYMKERYPNSNETSAGSQPSCNQDTNSTEYKQQVEVGKLSSELLIYCNLANYNIIGFFVTLNLSTYSDVYGRRLFFFPPLLGTLAKTILLAVIVFFNLRIELIIVANAIEGLTGNWVSTLSLVYGYMADLTEPGKPRTFVIGCFEASGGISAFVMTFLNGYIIKWTDGFFYPYLVSMLLTLLGLLIVIFLLPESLPVSKRRTGVSLFKNMSRVLDVYRPNFSEKGKRWMYVTLLFTFILSALACIARPQIETLYQLNAPFCWNSVKIGWFGALRLGAINAASIALIKMFHICDLSDEYIILASMVTVTISCTIEGIANNDFMLYLALGTSVGSTLGMSMSRAVMSRITPPDKQGSVFAGVAVPEVVFSLASGLGANAIYKATLSIYRGFTFLVMAGYGVIGIVLSMVLIIGQQRSKISSKSAGITVVVPQKNEIETG